MKQPCDRNCPERSPTCHTECDKYRRYEQQQRDEYKRCLEQSKVTTAIMEGRARCGKFIPTT